MINRAEMVRQRDIDEKLPILSSDKVREILETKIEIVRKGVEKRVRIAGVPNTHERYLFSITAEENSPLRGINWMDGKRGRAKTDDLQTIGLEVMKKYGLDEKISKPDAIISGNKGKDGVRDGEDDISTEFRLFPSQTIEGLSFRRIKQFQTSTGNPFSVSWYVVDKAPFLNVRFRKNKK